MAKQNVADESGSSTGDDTEASWVKGYEASDPKDANSPNRPSGQQYFGPGECATAYKAKWKDRPALLPNGEGDDGTL